MVPEMNKLSFLALFITMLSLQSSWATEIYKCTIKGKVVFTDQPCEGERITLSATNAIPKIDTHNLSAINAKKYSSSSWYRNARGYDDALYTSRDYQAPIFIYFEADWCGYCRKLERELLSKPEAQNALKQLVKVKISPETGQKEDALFKRMGGTGYPTIMIQMDESSTPRKISLQTKQGDQWRTKTVEEFEALLERYTQS